MWPNRRDIYDRDEKDIYLVRWTFLTLFGWRLRLHKIVREDNDTCLHDHPWTFIGVVFRGGYVEEVPDDRGGFKRVHRKPLSFFYHRPEFSHRIAEVAEGGSWTLLLCGPPVRPWGFISRLGAWRPWRTHIDSGPNRVAWCETEGGPGA